MCGIAGVIAKKKEINVSSIIDTLQQGIEHRGPDHYGLHKEDNRCFANRRLAIVGIEGGEQPIYTNNEKLGIVYNGEVYNYKSLRSALEEKGYEFHTHTDTEVVLKQFAEFGTKAFETLEGMFGICIWDEKEESVYIVRDGFGMKPMYVYEDENVIIYCSELSPIVNVSGLNLSLDPRGIKDYLTFRYVNAPHTLFKNVRKLYPGSYLKFQQGRLTEHFYKDILDIKSNEKLTDFEEAKQAVHDTLLASIEKHLIGEVPIALLLSGGVDSSILAALLHEMGTNMTCFNIGFDTVNEFEFSSSVAERYGFKLHNMELSTSDIFSSFDEILEALDEPIADPACFPLHILCKEIRKTATVVLSGEGADELFAGYPQYRDMADPRTFSQRIPSYLNNSYYFLDAEQMLKQNSPEAGWQRTIKYYQGSGSFDCMSNYDFKTWVPDNLMMKADKIAMRSSLEGRFPFLDYTMIELARKMPEEFLIGPNGETKYVLKEAFKKQLPDIILNRPKMGFTVPVADLVVEFQSRYLEGLKQLEKHEFSNIVDIDALRINLSMFVGGRTELALKNWTAFVLVTWLADRLFK